MTKVRVHELAKELNKSNKELLDILKEKSIEVKSHMSSLEDKDVTMLKTQYRGGGKTETPASAAPAAEGAKEEAPKKKNIVQVFRPQNSQSQSRSNQGQRQNQRPQGQGQRPNQTQGERPAQAQGERPASNEGQRTYNNNGGNGQGQRT